MKQLKVLFHSIIPSARYIIIPSTSVCWVNIRSPKCSNAICEFEIQDCDQNYDVGVFKNSHLVLQWFNNLIISTQKVVPIVSQTKIKLFLFTVLKIPTSFVSDFLHHSFTALLRYYKRFLLRKPIQSIQLPSLKKYVYLNNSALLYQFCISNVVFETQYFINDISDFFARNF